jgi:hypothetical protein
MEPLSNEQDRWFLVVVCYTVLFTLSLVAVRIRFTKRNNPEAEPPYHERILESIYESYVRCGLTEHCLCEKIKQAMLSAACVDRYDDFLTNVQNSSFVFISFMERKDNRKVGDCGNREHTHGFSGEHWDKWELRAKERREARTRNATLMALVVNAAVVDDSDTESSEDEDYTANHGPDDPPPPYQSLQLLNDPPPATILDQFTDATRLLESRLDATLSRADAILEATVKLERRIDVLYKHFERFKSASSSEED